MWFREWLWNSRKLNYDFQLSLRRIGMKQWEDLPWPIHLHQLLDDPNRMEDQDFGNHKQIAEWSKQLEVFKPYSWNIPSITAIKVLGVNHQNKTTQAGISHLPNIAEFRPSAPRDVYRQQSFYTRWCCLCWESIGRISRTRFLVFFIPLHKSFYTINEFIMKYARLFELAKKVETSLLGDTIPFYFLVSTLVSL